MSSLRLISLFCACLATLSAGTLYCFSLFGPALADRLELGLFQINLVATFGDYGLYLTGPILGALADRYGARLTSTVGGLFISLGYFGLSYCYAWKWSSVTILCCLAFLIGAGGTSAYMGAISTTARNWPSKSRGLMLGFPIGFYGLSAFAFSLFNAVFFVGNVADFLKWMGIVCALINVVCIFGLVRLPVTVPITPSSVENREARESDPLLPSAASPTTTTTTSRDTTTATALKEYLLDPSFLLLFLVIMVISGCGVMYINNIGVMASSILPRDTSPEDIAQVRNLHVSVLSIANFFSRILFGKASDWSGHRIVWVLVVGLMMSSSLVSSAYTLNPSWLFVWTALLGLSFGGFFTLCPTLVSEWWGAEHFGRNWGWAAMAPALGGLCFNSLFGLVYDANGGNNCQKKNQCYSFALITAAISVFITLTLIGVLIKKHY